METPNSIKNKGKRPWHTPNVYILRGNSTAKHVDPRLPGDMLYDKVLPGQDEDDNYDPPIGPGQALAGPS